MNQSTGRILSAFSRSFLIILAALVPIVIFPWTVDPLDINKQTVTVTLVVLATVAWLGSMLVRREMHFRATWLYAPLLAFLLSACVSSLLSLATYTSLVGQASQEYTSLLSLFAFSALFIVGLHVFSDRKTQQYLWGSLLLTGAVVALISSLTWFGFTFDVIPTNFIGTPDSLVLFLLVMSLLGAGLWLTSDKQDGVLPAGVFGLVARLATVVTSVCTLAAMLAIDYRILWFIAIVGVSVLFTFALARAREFPHPSRFILPMLFFVVSLLFIFFPSIIRNPFPSEIAPTFSTTWSITSQNLEETSMLFGSGPGTFAIAYGQYQPIALNDTSFWDTRFDRGASHILTLLATYGVVGALGFTIFVLLLGSLSLMRLIREREHNEWKLTFAPFAAWVMVVVAMVLYSQNFTLAFMFWLLSAVLAAHVAGQSKRFEFSTSPRAGLLAAFGFVVAMVCMLTGLLVTISRYRAEVAFARAVVTDRQNGDLDSILSDLYLAVKVNRLSDIANRNLANALLHKAAEMIEDINSDPEVVRGILSSAVTAATNATYYGPSNVANWQQLGDIYREVAPFISDGDAFEFAATAYGRAVELAPTNPRYHVDLARTELLRASQLETLVENEDEELAKQASEAYEQALTNAEGELRAAITLKNDYASALFYLAFVQERQGRLADAIRSMELVRTTNPSDVGVSMQLALLYLRQGKNELAKQELERAIGLVPNYANAHWYLASILEQEGDTEGALEALRVVQELNPDNTTVTNRIEQLKQGAATELIPDPIDEAGDQVTLPDGITP